MWRRACLSMRCRHFVSVVCFVPRFCIVKEIVDDGMFVFYCRREGRTKICVLIGPRDADMRVAYVLALPLDEAAGLEHMN